MKSGVCLTMQHIQDAVFALQGSTQVVFPEELPPYDPVRLELENREELAGTQDEKRVGGAWVF